MNRFSIYLILLALAVLPGCKRGEEPQRNYYAEVKAVNKLVLAQMSVSKMATIDDLKIDEANGPRQVMEAMLNAIKIGDRVAVYSYDTYMRAYIDLGSMTPDDISYDKASKTITLNLPRISTEFMGRDMEIREEHYRVNGLRSAIDEKERAHIKEVMNTAIKMEVENNTAFREKLISEAETKARAFFQSLLGENDTHVIVNFKN